MCGCSSSTFLDFNASLSSGIQLIFNETCFVLLSQVDDKESSHAVEAEADLTSDAVGTAVVVRAVGMIVARAVGIVVAWAAVAAANAVAIVPCPAWDLVVSLARRVMAVRRLRVVAMAALVALISRLALRQVRPLLALGRECLVSWTLKALNRRALMVRRTVAVNLAAADLVATAVPVMASRARATAVAASIAAVAK